MDKKLSAYFFLIPIGLLVLGGGIAIYLFYSAVVAPFMNMQEMEVNTPYNVNLTEGSFVSLFIEDDRMVDYEIFEYEDTYQLRWYYTDENFYNMVIDIRKSDEVDTKQGFYLNEISPSSAYTFDHYLNFGDIRIEEDGEYQIIFSSYDEIDASFAFAEADYSDSGMLISWSIVSGIIGVGGAIASFVVITVLRNKKPV